MSDADKLSYLDKLPARHRHTRAIVAAIVVVVAILALLSLRCNPVVGRVTVLGLCLEIKAENVTVGSQGEHLARVLIATPDQVEVELLVPPPVPRPGDFLPLVAEQYKKGNVSYEVDAVKWRAEGPQ